MVINIVYLRKNSKQNFHNVSVNTVTITNMGKYVFLRNICFTTLLMVAMFTAMSINEMSHTT